MSDQTKERALEIHVEETLLGASGWQRPEVTEAVVRQAALGANFAYVNENSLAVAEEVCRVSPACDRLRFCASGTEATMYCQRFARTAAGRRMILKFEGACHGANEVG